MRAAESRCHHAGASLGHGQTEALGSAPCRAAAEQRRSAGHCPQHPPGNTFRSHGTTEAPLRPGCARLLLLALQAKNQRRSLLQFYSNQVLSSDGGSLPITEVSSRINFSPRHNEINLKTFAAVIIFDLFYNLKKKIPHPRDFNHLSITTSLFSSQKNPTNQTQTP